MPTPAPGEPTPEAATITRLAVFRGTDPTAVKAFETWLGRDVDLVVDFPARSTWAEIADPQYMLDTWKGTPYQQVYAIALLPQDDPTATIALGATGRYDGYYRELAQRLVDSGQADATIRLGWEFNLASSRWSSADPKAFVAYWRQVVTTMRAQPGQRFRFDWNPNNGAGDHDAVGYYPGDDLVDEIGVDAYDVAGAPGSYPYPPGCDPACRLRHERQAWSTGIYGGPRGLRFWSRFAAAHDRPLALPEWGLWSRDDGQGGGEDPYYLRQMAAFIADPVNDVSYQSYFEFDGPDGTHRLMTDFLAGGRLFRSLFG